MALGLGTELRRLIDSLDRSIDQIYRNAGVDFRPRYYPYVQLLAQSGERSVGEIASELGFTQPAVTQTLNLMLTSGLVERIATADRRKRRFRLSSEGRAIMGGLEPIWRATERAARRLEHDIGMDLTAAASAALARLDQVPFARMIDEEMAGCA